MKTCHSESAHTAAVARPLIAVAGRLLRAVLLVLGISFLSFAVIQLSPGDPAEVAIRVSGMRPTPELLAETRARLDLDRPFPVRYLLWLGRALRGDLGTRHTDGKSVAGELAAALPPTLLLAATAALIVLLCSVPAAVLSACHAGKAPDILLRGLILLGTSVPSYWAGLLLIWLFAVHWNLLPLGGLDRPASLILPAVTLALPYIAAYTRLLRAAILQTREQDFVRYARACGRRERAILGHVLRNSLQSCLTALGMSLPRLVAGTFVVECIFAWPGLGRLCITAVFTRDFPVIQAYVLLMAVLFLFFGRLMELCAALADPRLRHGGRA